MFQALGPWINYVDDAMATYNSYASPNLDGLSPYELVYGRKAKVAPDWKFLFQPQLLVSIATMYACYKNN